MDSFKTDEIQENLVKEDTRPILPLNKILLFFFALPFLLLLPAFLAIFLYIASSFLCLIYSLFGVCFLAFFVLLSFFVRCSISSSPTYYFVYSSFVFLDARGTNPETLWNFGKWWIEAPKMVVAFTTLTHNQQTHVIADSAHVVAGTVISITGSLNFTGFLFPNFLLLFLLFLFLLYSWLLSHDKGSVLFTFAQ